jgi:hypothetical protein
LLNPKEQIDFSLVVDVDGLLNHEPAAEQAFLDSFRLALEQQVAATGSSQTWETMRAGLLLTFSARAPGPGEGLSKARNDLLIPEDPFARDPFAGAVRRDYVEPVGEANYTTVRFEIFLYSTVCEDEQGTPLPEAGD